MIARFRYGRYVPEVDPIPYTFNEWFVTTDSPDVAAAVAARYGSEVVRWSEKEPDPLGVLTGVAEVPIVVDGIDAHIKMPSPREADVRIAVQFHVMSVPGASFAPFTFKSGSWHLAQTLGPVLNAELPARATLGLRTSAVDRRGRPPITITVPTLELA